MLWLIKVQRQGGRVVTVAVWAESTNRAVEKAFELTQGTVVSVQDYPSGRVVVGVK